MENNLIVKSNRMFGELRIIIIEDEPWFIGKEIADKLGYAKPRNAVANHVEEEDRGVAPIKGDLGGTQEMTIINESGLYSLVLSSKLPSAKQFKKWVTKEVLPSIRKNGMYATDELLNNPDLLIAAATKLKEERAARMLLEEEKKQNEPKVLFADSVCTSNTSILIGELAKILKQNGINIGEKRLFEYLRNKGYLIKRKGIDWNMPTQKSMDLGLFEIKERTVNNPDGSTRITKTPKVTGKGQIYFVNKFLKEEIK